jgi:hypothetical protein
MSEENDDDRFGIYGSKKALAARTFTLFAFKRVE